MTPIVMKMYMDIMPSEAFSAVHITNRFALLTSLCYLNQTFRCSGRKMDDQLFPGRLPGTSYYRASTVTTKSRVRTAKTVKNNLNVGHHSTKVIGHAVA
jgi:hypothetical protein